MCGIRTNGVSSRPLVLILELSLQMIEFEKEMYAYLLQIAEKKQFLANFIVVLGRLPFEKFSSVEIFLLGCKTAHLSPLFDITVYGFAAMLRDCVVIFSFV